MNLTFLHELYQTRTPQADSIWERYRQWLIETEPSLAKALRVGAFIEAALAEARRSGYDYFESWIHGAVQALWDGSEGISAFTERVTTAIDGSYEAAWFEGAAEVGIQPGEETEDERAVLEELKDAAKLFIDDFAAFVLEHSKGSAEGDADLEQVKLQNCFNRAALWVNQYAMVKNVAKVTVGGDVKMEWVLGATEKHCRDCANLDGRVYRASTWDRWGIYPGAHELACSGYNCDCRLTPTDKPLTPGKPPALHGG